jgi:hypothetical protein
VLLRQSNCDARYSDGGGLEGGVREGACELYKTTMPIQRRNDISKESQVGGHVRSVRLRASIITWVRADSFGLSGMWGSRWRLITCALHRGRDSR